MESSGASAQALLVASTARSTAVASVSASPVSTPSRTISWPCTASLSARCPTLECPLNSAVSRARRSRDQRGLGAPDNGMRRRTPTCPTGSGSPLAGPTMVCFSAMFPSRTSMEIRVALEADRAENLTARTEPRRRLRRAGAVVAVLLEHLLQRRDATVVLGEIGGREVDGPDHRVGVAVDDVDAARQLLHVAEERAGAGEASGEDRAVHAAGGDDQRRSPTRVGIQARDRGGHARDQ